jgi:hypothetical protein
MNAYLFANFPRYVVSKLLYRGFRSLVDSLPDIALIGGFTALFVFMWSKFFIK